MSNSPLQLTFGARQRAFLTSAVDFHKQRTTVTRRVHRLRRHLQIQQKDTKKYNPTKITPEIYSSNDKFYTLGLMNVEKDFLYALELRAQSDDTVNVNNTAAKQKLLVTRLKRALQRSLELLDASVGEPDKLQRLELLVYSELIRAQTAIASKRWAVAIDAFSLARCSLQFLENEGPSESKILYKDIIEENVDESLKLAIYRDSKVNSADLTEYTKKIVQEKHHHHEIFTIVSSFEQGEEYLTSMDESELVKEIQWREYSARVKDETTSRLLSRSDKTQLDSLTSFDDKLSLLQTALETHQSYIARSIQDDEEQDDQILLAYIKYTLLLTRAQRDSSLLAKANKNESLRILDTIKSTIKEAEELPGVYSDDELFTNLEFIVKFFDSFKLDLLSDVFAQSKEFPKALALSTEALTSLKSIQFTVEFPGLVTIEQLQERTTRIQATQRQLHILTQLSLHSNSQHQSISDNLNEFATTHTKIVNLEIEPVPSKPVLFDVAFNYISYPQVTTTRNVSREQSPLKSEVGEEQKTKKKGLFGLFG